MPSTARDSRLDRVEHPVASHRIVEGRAKMRALAIVAGALGTYPHVLVSSKEYLARAGAPSRPEELESHSILGFGGRRRFVGWDLVPLRGGAPVHVNVRPALSSNDFATIIQAVRAGMGIAELPAILCEQRASLVRVLPKWTLGDVTVHLLFASDRLLSRAVRAVVDAIIATVPEQTRKAVKGVAKIDSFRS